MDLVDLAPLIHLSYATLAVRNPELVERRALRVMRRIADQINSTESFTGITFEQAEGVDLLSQALERARLMESDPEADDLTRAEVLALAAVVERAREWFADVDLVYPSQTEQHIRNALREILEGPDES
jgi:DNA polymerase/3'-5' exonuclease PolX